MVPEKLSKSAAIVPVQVVIAWHGMGQRRESYFSPMWWPMTILNSNPQHKDMDCILQDERDSWGVLSAHGSYFPFIIFCLMTRWVAYCFAWLRLSWLILNLRRVWTCTTTCMQIIVNNNNSVALNMWLNGYDDVSMMRMMIHGVLKELKTHVSVRIG